MRFRTGSLRVFLKRAAGGPNLIGTAVVAILALLSSVAFFQGVSIGAALTPNILAPTVTGSINTQDPGTEAFWNQITPLVVPLTATDTYGGTVQSVSVKIATNGTYLLMEATYAAAHQDNSSVTTGAPTAPAADVGLFYANATIHRSDQFAVWWAMTQNPGPPPCMQVPYATNMHGGKSPGAIAGTGNVWRWVASSTDTQGTTYATAKFGAGIGPLAGHPINYTHPFASNMLLNTTGFYLLGVGSSNINSTVLKAPDGAPYDPWIVWERGVYNSTAHTYTQVIARPMTVTPTANNVQFGAGTVYNFAMAVFAGGPNPIPAGVPAPAGWTSMADTDETKSISTWVTVEFSGLAPQQTSSSAGATTTAGTVANATGTTTTALSTTATSATSVSSATVSGTPSTVISTVTEQGGPAFQTATAASLIAMIVGVIVGMVAVGRFSGRKSS
jgi:hypothetical protein